VNTVTIIGLGNLGSHLAIAFRKKLNTVYVWSRDHSKAHTLAQEHDCICFESILDVPEDSKLIILSVADDAIEETAKLISFCSSLIVHTAGSVNMSVLDGICSQYGVLYPLQSFRKERLLEYHTIPVFIEGSSSETTQVISDVCKDVFPLQTEMNSDKRMHLHLSAVFASNFVNALYQISYDITKKHQINFAHVIPLIIETAVRLHDNKPEQLQTGPALRNDNTVVNKHIEMLKDDRIIQTIYKEITNYIKTKK